MVYHHEKVRMRTVAFTTLGMPLSCVAENTVRDVEPVMVNMPQLGWRADVSGTPFWKALTTRRGLAVLAGELAAGAEEG